MLQRLLSATTRGGRVKLRLLAAVVALVAALVGSVAGRPVKAQAAEGCADVLFIGVHGVGEDPSSANHNMGPTIHEVFKDFESKVKAKNPDANVGGFGVNYPKISLLQLLSEKALGGVVSDNVADGVAALKQAVTTQTHVCPGFPIVLAGYSEGAWVIDTFLHDNSDLVGAITAVTLFGDPQFDHSASGIIRGAVNGDGIARDFSLVLSAGKNSVVVHPYAIDPYLPSELKDRAASWCLAEPQGKKLVHDPVCNWRLYNRAKNETVSSCIKADTCPHYDYGEAKYLTAGADFLISKLPPLGQPKRKVYVSTAGGRVLVFDPATSSTPTQTLSTGLDGETTDPTVDAAGNLYVADFSHDSVTVFPNAREPASRFATNLPSSPESLVFHGTSLFVGSANGQTLTQLGAITGLVENSFTPEIEDRGVDWFDFGRDGCTILYTSEGKSILSYDTCTRTQGPTLTTSLPGTAAYELHLLPDGGALIADSEMIVRTDLTGAVAQQYDSLNNDTWFAVALDPDGRTFWAGDYNTGEVLHFDLLTGERLGSLDTGGSNVEGLTVTIH
jgi:hypothetical protein